MTALTIIAACLALILYIHFAAEFALWLSKVADTFWYDSGLWVHAFVVVTLTVAPIAILVEVVT
jgi:hypothetical protein